MFANPWSKIATRVFCLIVLVFSLALLTPSKASAATPQCDQCVSVCDAMERECDRQIAQDPNFDYNSCILDAASCMNDCLFVCLP